MLYIVFIKFYYKIELRECYYFISVFHKKNHIYIEIKNKRAFIFIFYNLVFKQLYFNNNLNKSRNIIQCKIEPETKKKRSMSKIKDNLCCCYIL